MKIALGVTGGIAAYKAAEILRQLQDRGVEVQVVMTRAAQEFVRPLTFAALSGKNVITEMFADGAIGAQRRLFGRAYRRGAIDRCLAGGAGNGRHAGQVRQRHRLRLSVHFVSGDHGSRDRRARHERKHVAA